MKKSSKKILSLVMPLILLFSFISVTFAWYISTIEKDGFEFNTGDMQLELKAYEHDKESQSLTSIALKDYTESVDLETQPAFNFTFNETKQVASFYLTVEKGANSVDFDYSLSFAVNGFTSDSSSSNLSLDVIGGFKYSIIKVNTSMNFTLTEEEQKDVALNNLTKYCNDETLNVPGNEETFTAVSHLSNDVRISTLDDNNLVDYYRFDIKPLSTTTGSDYYGKQFQLRTKVKFAQVGALNTGEGIGETYKVTTVEELETILNVYKPGDNIHITNDMTINHDLVFTKPVNLYVNGKTLKINGNLKFDYAVADSSLVNTTNSGRIVVSQVGNSGGNLQVNTPSSSIHFRGSNLSTLGKGDIYVQSKVTIQTESEIGAVFEGSNIYGTDLVGGVNATHNLYKDINVSSGTKINVFSNSEIGRILATTGCEYIHILNNGTISYINLNNMYQRETGGLQVIIDNNGIITGDKNGYHINLQYWAELYNESTGVGNTKVIQNLFSNILNLTENSPNYTNAHIIKQRPSELVTMIDNNPAELSVYYADEEGEDGSIVTNTLKTILTNYFTTHLNSSVANTQKLVIQTAYDKALTPADYAYIRTFTNVITLDLSECKTAYIENYIMNNKAYSYYFAYSTSYNSSSGAFNGMTNLTNIKLPYNIQCLSNYSFGGTKVKEIYVPETFQYMDKDPIYRAFNGVKYIHFTSPTIKVSFISNAYKNQYANNIFFFPEETADYYLDSNNFALLSFNGYLDSYLLLNNFFVESQLDVSENYLVRELDDGTYEITGYIGEEQAPVDIGGQPIYIKDKNGIEKQIVVTSIGKHAFARRYMSFGEESNQYHLTIAEGIKYIDQRAFWSNNSVVTIEFPSSLETIGAEAFRYNTMLTEIDTKNTISIGRYCFADSKALQVAILPNVDKIPEYTFYQTYNMKVISAPKATSIESYGLHYQYTLKLGYFPSCTRLATNYMYNDVTTYDRNLIVVGELENVEKESLLSDSIVKWKEGAIYVMIHNENNTSITPTGTFSGNLFIMSQETADLYGSYTSGAFNRKQIHENLTVDNLYFETGVALKDVRTVEDAGTHLFVVDKAKKTSTLATTISREVANATTFTIPNGPTIDGELYLNTKIGNRAFMGLTLKCESIIVPEGVEEIEDYAFYHSDSTYAAHTFTNIVLPSTLKVIGNGAFRYNSTKFTINLDSVELVDDYAFANSGIVEANFSPNLKSLGEYTFYSATQLLSFSAFGLESIGDRNFQEASRLAKVYMPKLTHMGDLNFYSIHNLAVVEVGQFSTTGTSGNFNNNGSQGMVIFHGDTPATTVQKIANNNIHFGKGVFVVENGLFTHYSNHITLARVTELPVGITVKDIKYFGDFKRNDFQIGEYAYFIHENQIKVLFYYGTKTLTTENFAADLAALSEHENGLPVTTLYNNAFRSANLAEGFVFPEGITHIGSYAFRRNESKTNTIYDITLPSTLQVLGRYSFCNSSVTNVTWETCPEGAIIEDGAFYKAMSLQKVVLPDGLTELRYAAFQESSITDLVWETCPEGAFTGTQICYRAKSLQNVTLPNGLQYIGGEAFRESTIVNLNWPNSAPETEVDTYAFYATYSFKTAILPDNLTIVRNSAFRETNVDLDFSRVKTAKLQCESYAFANNYGMRELVLPDTMTSFTASGESGIFSSCTQLRTIKANGITSLSQKAFNNCTKLVSGEFNSVKSTGSDVFNNCPSLINVNIGPATIGNIQTGGKLDQIHTIFVDGIVTSSTTGYPMHNNITSLDNAGTILTAYITYESNKPFLYDKSSIYGNARYSTAFRLIPDGVDYKLFTESDYPFVVNDIKSPKFVYYELNDEIYLVHCMKREMTSEELVSDIAKISMENGGKPVVSINDRCFYYTKITGSLTFPDTIRNIGYGAFWKTEEFRKYVPTCDSELELLDTNNVETIADYAFSYHTIEILVLGPQTSSIGKNAFINIKKLINVTLKIPSETAAFIPDTLNFSTSNHLYVSSAVYGYYTAEPNRFGQIPIENIHPYDECYIEETSGYTYYYELVENKITLSSIVQHNDELESEILVLPTSLPIINGEVATYYDITKILKTAFYPLQNINIKKIILPENLEQIEYDYNYAIISLEEYEITTASLYFTTGSDGVLYNKDVTEIVIYPIGKKDTVYVIPSTVSSFNVLFASGNPYLEEVQISR